MIAGQGTIGLELAEQLPDVGTFVLPVGGGGLAAGIAIALRALRPGVRIVGVQAGKTGRGTIADGIAVKHPGTLTMAILDELLDDLVHVEDEEISRRSRCCSSARSSLSREPAPRRSPRSSTGRWAARARCARCSPAATSTRRS